MQQQDGSIALEAVLALPLVVVVLAAVLGTTTVIGDQLAATRAARAAARTVALTGETGLAAGVARGTAPGATTAVEVHGGTVTVTVRIAADLLGVGYAVDATAAAPLEPAAGRQVWQR